MTFDFAKQTSLKYIVFYRLFENREISNVKKNVIKPYDLSTFQFWYVERSRGGAVQHNNNNNPGGTTQQQPASQPSQPRNQPTSQASQPSPAQQPTSQAVQHNSSQPASQPSSQPTNQPRGTTQQQPASQPPHCGPMAWWKVLNFVGFYKVILFYADIAFSNVLKIIGFYRHLWNCRKSQFRKSLQNLLFLDEFRLWKAEIIKKRLFFIDFLKIVKSQMSKKRYKT